MFIGALVTIAIYGNCGTNGKCEKIAQGKVCENITKIVLNITEEINIEYQINDENRNESLKCVVCYVKSFMKFLQCVLQNVCCCFASASQHRNLPTN